MNSRFTQILIVVGAIIAFLPVLAVDFLLDNYVRDRETQSIFEKVQAITTDTQSAVYSSTASMAKILSDSPSLCTPTFVGNAQKQLQGNIYLEQVLVENADGVQYCDGYGITAKFSELSHELVIPGSDDTISIVQFEESERPSLRITRALGTNRMISVFVHLTPKLTGTLPPKLSDADFLRLRLTDGTGVYTVGDPALLDSEATSGKYIYAQSIADALPLMVEVLVPFDVLRSEYTELSVAITVVASLMSAAFLLLAFHYVRQARLPAFEFERALRNGELKPYYQPIMNMTDGSLVGCEMLVRWQKRNGEVVPPGAFIEYAEATGLAIPMTIKLMKQLRDDLSDLCAKAPDIKIGINLFEGHFRDTSIVEDVQAIFEDSKVSYRQLVFEITERRPLQDQIATNSVIGGLQALGCRIAMDDAGTGHSNLEYISTLGIDILKIDKVFVSMISDGAESVPVLDGLITMASDMKLRVVAEGIETEEQAIYLRERGVVEAQGFLFAPALTGKSFVELADVLLENFGSGRRTSSLPRQIGEALSESDPEEAAA